MRAPINIPHTSWYVDGRRLMERCLTSDRARCIAEFASESALLDFIPSIIAVLSCQNAEKELVSIPEDKDIDRFCSLYGESFAVSGNEDLPDFIKWFLRTLPKEVEPQRAALREEKSQRVHVETPVGKWIEASSGSPYRKVPFREVISHLGKRGFVTREKWRGGTVGVFGMDNSPAIHGLLRHSHYWALSLEEIRGEDWVILPYFWKHSEDDLMPFKRDDWYLCSLRVLALKRYEENRKKEKVEEIRTKEFATIAGTTYHELMNNINDILEKAFQKSDAGFNPYTVKKDVFKAIEKACRIDLYK